MSLPSGCRKSRRLFSTACNNAGIFVPRSGTKIVASRHAHLAEQGLARHLIPFEVGVAPSSSPCEEERLHARQGFIHTQKGGTASLPFSLYNSREIVYNWTGEGGGRCGHCLYSGQAGDQVSDTLHRRTADGAGRRGGDAGSDHVRRGHRLL